MKISKKKKTLQQKAKGLEIVWLPKQKLVGTKLSKICKTSIN
jgi:hypothetical protein